MWENRIRTRTERDVPMSYGTLMNNANPLVSALPALLTSFWVATGPNRQSETVAQTLRQVFITLRDYKVTRGNECDRSTSCKILLN